MTQRFSVKAVVPGIGLVHHLIMADTADAAWQRLCRAYPNREIIEFHAQRRDVEIEEDAHQ